MSLGYIGFGTPDTTAFPSSAMWSDCINTVLNDKGLGYFMAQDFLGNYSNPSATTIAPGIESFTGTTTALYAAAASATFGPNVLSIGATTSDNANTAIFGEELGSIVKNSGKKLWFEARVAPSALADASVFFGFTTLAGAKTATTGILAADPSNSAAAVTVAVTTVGFISAQASSAIATMNAIYSKGAGSPVTVLANVGASSAFTASGTNGAQFPGGVPTGFTAPGNLLANTFVKYGLRFDGYQTLEFYVNGVRVASQTVDSTVDQTALLVPIVAVHAGSTAGQTINVDFIRAAFQDHA